MAGKEQINWPPKAEIERILDDSSGFEGKNGAAARLGVSAPGLRHHCKKLGIEIPRPAWKRDLKPVEPAGMRQRARTEVRGDTAQVVTPPSPKLGDLETMIREAGLDPDEWEVATSKLNKWQALARGGDAPEVVWLHQLTVNLRRRIPVDWLFPAVHVPPVKHPRIKAGKGEPERGVFLSDPHCPYHDRALDALIETFLRWYRPHVGVFGGDVPDFPTLSQHKRNPAYDASPQECIQSAYGWLRGKVDATPGCEWTYLPGNHCIRPRSYTLERAPEAYGLAPAAVNGDDPEPETVGQLLARLLHFDALGITLCETPGDGQYEKAEKVLTGKLSARHGWITGANAGKRTADRLGNSVIHGHDHSLALNYKTRWEMGVPMQLAAAGAGCLADISDGLGYAEVPDWQNGCMAWTAWPDGRFHLEPVIYTAGSLFFRDQRWTA